ncbi:DUF3794 domain-containing protein [Sporohalobacter salinus]|uniref:DUF3794 domain-containing protein n=1 Tax=Sporohalobacter salinus TaxID=1494606 RepID=UPI001961E1BB|nr:DUF3794 domain-containing protein [Sporohalobacter salinus]MBM7625156.1 hypothetical protein [Sporohalobacter salinus]
MSYLNDLIEVVGVAECFPELCSDCDFWTQISVPENLTIPEQKPDVEQLVKVSARVEIFSKRIVKTPVSCGPNLAGNCLTGRKLIIEGHLKQKVFYVADLPEQPVHAAHFQVPFSAFIIIPSDIDSCTKFRIIPYIEDVFVKMINKRDFFKNVALFLQAKRTDCCC